MTAQEQARLDRRGIIEKRAKDVKLVSEEGLDEIIKAAGAKKIEPEARRALRALGERELTRVATRAADEAKRQGRESVDSESVALAAAADRRELVEEQNSA